MTQKLRDQDRAFANFFEGRAKYPKFKKKHHAQAILYQLDQRVVAGMYRPGQLLKLPKLRELKLRWSQVPGGIPKLVTVRKDAAGRYFVAFMVEEEVQALPEKPNGIGLDIGLKDLAVTSEGERIGNPRPLYRAQRRLKHAQRILSRRKKGSANWHRQRRKVARLHARLADVRRDLLHNASAQLVQGAGLIAIEDLNVVGMMKNRRLAKAIGDASFGELRRQIQYKAGWYGREVVVIDRWAPSSKACSGCGHVLPELPLSVRSWTCPVCGAEHDRDVNAARNLLAWATGGVPGTRNDACGAVKTPEALAA